MKKKKPSSKGQISRRPGRPTTIPKVLFQLKKLGIFKVADAKKMGLSKTTLRRLVVADQINALGAGYYIHPDSKIPYDERDYVLACAKFGSKAVIGGMTALSRYHLIEKVPRRVWVLVPYGSRTRDKLYRFIRTKTDPREGIVSHGNYRITNIERTIVEAFRYASKIGLRTAFRAARTAIEEKQTSLEKIYRQAKSLGMDTMMQKHWEALVQEGQAQG